MRVITEFKAATGVSGDRHPCSHGLTASSAPDGADAVDADVSIDGAVDDRPRVGDEPGSARAGRDCAVDMVALLGVSSDGCAGW